MRSKLGRRLKQIMRKAQRAPGLAEGSSIGGNLDFVETV